MSRREGRGGWRDSVGFTAAHPYPTTELPVKGHPEGMLLCLALHKPLFSSFIPPSLFSHPSPVLYQPIFTPATAAVLLQPRSTDKSLCLS